MWAERIVWVACNQDRIFAGPLFFSFSPFLDLNRGLSSISRLCLSTLSLSFSLSANLSLAGLSQRTSLSRCCPLSLAAISLSHLAAALFLSLRSLSLSLSLLLSPISLRQTLSPSSAIAAAISLSLSCLQRAALPLSSICLSRLHIFIRVFDSKPKEDIEKLMSTIDGMVSHGPSFCDLTWRPGGLETDLTLKVAGKMQNEVGVETLLHLAVTSMTMEMIDHALDTAKAKGTNNILALKGDPVKGKDPAQDPLQCALYLVKYIRAKHGDYFGIAVAGYPVCRKKESATNILEKEEVFMEHLFVVISASRERDNLKNLIKLTVSIRDIRMLD